MEPDGKFRCQFAAGLNPAAEIPLPADFTTQVYITDISFIFAV
jgi:hypothetical protein